MKPFCKILVPIDFSPYSSDALRLAADISRRYEASVTLLHVWEPELIEVPGSPQLYDSATLPDATTTFNKQLEGARAQLRAAGVIQVDTALARGKPQLEIPSFAQVGGFDLIVMGTHGRSGLAHALLGSVAERVVRRAPCAVLTARPRVASPRSPKDEQVQA